MNKPLNRPTILVVDDRPQNLIAMKVVLRSLEADLVCVTTGREAIEVARTCSDLAVILLDVQMPEMDGFETAEALRQQEASRGVPIIFVTAGADSQGAAFRGYECGAVDFLAKPITDFILLSKVRVFLELSLKQTSLERALDALEASKAELTESNAALQVFAQAAAHDLKAPLRHILFHSDVILEDFGDDLQDEVTEEVQAIVHTTTRMHGLVNGLLSYATVGSVRREFTAVDTMAILESVLRERAAEVEGSGARIELGELPAVYGDPLLLHQVFQNLIGNSLKYCHSDVMPHIQVSCIPSGSNSSCCISFTDNGIGFEPDDAERIFEPLKRLVSSTEYEGSGIGLASVKRLVGLLGGNIVAHGEPGKGATFELTLPIISLLENAA